MAKKKIIKQNELKDCSKCNSVREINNELHLAVILKLHLKLVLGLSLKL